jgi:hypothetical protein
MVRNADAFRRARSEAGWGLALDSDRCIDILGECGFLPTGPVGLVDLCQIPDCLNAEELERFLREHGAETRELRGTQAHGEPADRSYDS